MIWIKTSEQLPPEGTKVIAWAEDGKNQVKDLMMETFYFGGEFNYGYYNNQMRGVTHWMYFPERPYD